MLENYVTYGLIGLGILIIGSNFINIQEIVSKLFFKRVNSNTVVVNKQNEFLTIVNLWYQLKQKCDLCKLTTASEKLDEVFPLLNGALDEQNT